MIMGGISVVAGGYTMYRNISPIMRGAKSVHGYAASVTEGGTGNAFSGHGEIRNMSGTTVVPEGTSITMWTGEGNSIPDAMGKLIEMGKYDKILSNPKYIKNIRTRCCYTLQGATITNFNT